MNKYKAIITTAGAAKIAAASAGGTQLKIVSMAVGDGNGTLPTPNPAQTKLVNEKYRAALNGLTIDKALKNHILAEMIIPANKGGWWLREMGLYDEAGTLIAVSNMAESYKPKLEEGSGRTQTLRMILIVSSTEAIQVIAGGDTVLATKDFVADAIAAHEKTRNHPDASTTAKGLVQLSSATTSTDETKASTPKALKTVSDASMKKDANLSDLTNKAAARGNLALGDAATRNVGGEVGQLMAVGAFGLGSGAVPKTDAYNNVAQFYRVNDVAENKPPISRTSAGVVSLPIDGAPTAGYLAISGRGDAWIGCSTIAANGVTWHQVYTTAYKPTAADVGALTDAQAVQKFVQRSIKVNGKPLSTDVNLLAGDVNAWNKTEADSRFVKQGGDTMSGPLTLPRVVFPNENTASADTDVNRENGFTVESLVATTNKGYPVPGGMGVLFTGKVNEFRNVQFAVGSGDLSFYLRSMRKDSPTSTRWAQVYTTDYKPTLADVQAADHRNNFAARMGIQRVLTGADMPTSAGVWSVENSAWTPVPWGSLYVTTNQSTLSTEPGNQRFIHYLFIGHGNGNKLYAATNNNGSFSGWSQYYSTAGKPTAADVGALTDAQAAQKYALRSIKVNGKPLSADVNLLAGDVNAWNKTEADGRYLAKTGGQLTGTLKTNAEIQSTNIDNYRMIGGGFGSFWRNDGNRLYLLLTNENDQYGTFNALRPFSVDVRTGAAAFESGIHIGGKWPAITTSSGTTWHPDGNVQGSCWGGYLSNWLNQNISAAQNNAQNWAYQNLVQGVRMAGRTVIADTGGRIDLPSGCVYTGMSGSNYNPSIWGAYSAVQVLINGTWATIGTV
ncbi:phage tail protein [Serratia marcescens]